jgi:hypothetical protein
MRGILMEKENFKKTGILQEIFCLTLNKHLTLNKCLPKQAKQNKRAPDHGQPFDADRRA